MTSIRDRILKAVNQKEIDTLVEESKTFEFCSTNTKTKIRKAVVERINSLSGKKIPKNFFMATPSMESIITQLIVTWGVNNNNKSSTYYKKR